MDTHLSSESLERAGSIIPEIQSSSIVKIVLLERNEDIYALIAKEYSFECFLLYEEEKYLSKCCAFESGGKQIIDFILSKNTIFVLCLDGTILITTLTLQEDGSIICSTWKELSNTRSDSSNSHPPVKLLSLNDNTIVVMYLQNEIRFVNTETLGVVSFEFNGVHMSSCSSNNIIYLYLNSGYLYRLDFNSNYDLVSSKKSKMQKQVISLHHINNESVIAVTEDSALLYLNSIKVEKEIVLNTKGRLISDLYLKRNSCYICTEYGDIYISIDDQEPSLCFENSHVDHLCAPSSNNFMIGYSSASNVYYLPLENGESNNPIKLLSTISHVVDFEKRDDEYILALPNSLTSVKKGISCRTSSLTDESYEGLDKLFTINNGSDKYIILSFFNQSKVLKVQEDSIEDYSTQHAFNLNDSTLYASTIFDCFILQITPKETRIMNHEMTHLLCTVTSSKSLATSYNNMIYQSFENKVTGYIVSEDGKIDEKFTLAVDNDISCIYAYRDGELIVATYSGLVYSISSSHVVITNTLDINEYCIDTNITESILMVNDMLLIGLRDGNLLCFDATHLTRKYKLGNYPVQLHKSYDNNSLIATSNLSYFITLSPHEFNVSNLIINEQILSMQNFNLGFESSLLCLTGDNKIKIIIVEPESFQPSVTEIAPGDYQRVVAIEENLLLIVSSNYCKLQIMNEANEMMTIHHFHSEQIFSVMQWHSTNEEDLNKKIKYILVGTKYIHRKVNPIIMNTDSTRSSLGNIHLLKMTTSNNKYACSHVFSMELPNMVYCLSQLNSQYFVAGYGDRLGLFEVSSDGFKLIDQANVRNFVNSISVVNSLIAITDRYDGLLFFTIQEGKLLYLYNLTSQLHPLNCATCQFINPNTIATIDRNHELIIWQIRYPVATMSQNPNTISVLEKQRYQTKELALKIKALPNNKLFYVTITGSVCCLELQN